VDEVNIYVEVNVALLHILEEVEEALGVYSNFQSDVCWGVVEKLLGQLKQNLDSVLEIFASQMCQDELVNGDPCRNKQTMHKITT